MEEKVQAGVRFFQTQAVYDPGTFEKFANRVQRFSVPVLVGQIVLKSGNMARNLNANLPGVYVHRIVEVGPDIEKRIERRTVSVTTPEGA